MRRFGHRLREMGQVANILGVIVMIVGGLLISLGVYYFDNELTGDVNVFALAIVGIVVVVIGGNIIRSSK